MKVLRKAAEQGQPQSVIDAIAAAAGLQSAPKAIVVEEAPV